MARETTSPSLIKLLEADDDPAVIELALKLPQAWSYLGERPTATYALRKPDTPANQRNFVEPRSSSHRDSAGS